MSLFDEFEEAMRDAFEETMMRSDDFCEEIWGNLANRLWYKGDEKSICYSFGAATKLIERISQRREGRRYASSLDPDTPTWEVDKGMRERGWRSCESEQERVPVGVLEVLD